MFQIAVLCVVFGLWLGVFDLALLAFSAPALRSLAGFPAKARATGIFVVRFLPLTLAAAITLGIFVPAWWVHEPENAEEALTLAQAAAAFVAFAPLGEGLRRAMRMASRTHTRLVDWRRRGQKSGLAASCPFDVVEVYGEGVALCVGGYFKPTIFASIAAMKVLTMRERRAALAHESSHASSLDPLRLLGMEACPDFLRLLSVDAEWRSAFARAVEFAADARASAGDRGTALDLAQALVKVARLGLAAPLKGLSVAPAMSNSVDLKARVDALANGPMDEDRRLPLSSGWALVLVCAAVCVLGTQESETAQRLTEAIVALLR